MTTLLTLVTLLIYGALYIRVRSKLRIFPVSAVCAFIVGLSLAYASVVGPLDTLSDRSLSWHMIQHLILTGISAPLLVLGAPVRLVLAALPTEAARAVTRVLNGNILRPLSDPFIAWLQFQAVLYIAHLSPLYEAALESETIHACEHLLFIVAAAIFWQAMLAVAPAPHAAPYYVRILLLVFAIPMGALLGFIFYVARTPWYAHYARLPGALLDQQNAGALMWGLGSLPFFVVLLFCVAAWSKDERRASVVREG